MDDATEATKSNEGEAVTMETDPQSLKSDIFGFDRLFVEKTQSRQENKNNEHESRIPFGSTLLISGAPGAGKTTFALALVRSIMLNKIKYNNDNSKDVKDIFLYVSPEVSGEQLKETFAPLGWFGLRSKDQVWQNGDTDETSYYLVAPEPDLNHPSPTPEVQINRLFDKISSIVANAEGKPRKVRYFVVIDSITALLKQCSTPGEERRHAHELIHRLNSALGPKTEGSKSPGIGMALAIFLAEQDASCSEDGAESLVEDYLVNIVFRLMHKPLSLGRRARTLEIVKSQGVNMIPGEHSWAIIAQDNYEEIFRSDEIRTDVKSTAVGVNSENYEQRWATIAVFPRPRLTNPPFPSNSERLSNANHTRMLRTGTHGLDQLIKREQKFWLRPSGTRKPQDGAIKAGSTTLLVGSVGTGKSTLCKQFVFSGLIEYVELLLSDSFINIERANSGPEQTSNNEIDNSFLGCAKLFTILTEHLTNNIPETIKSRPPLAVYITVAIESVNEMNSYWNNVYESITKLIKNRIKTLNNKCDITTLREFMQMIDERCEAYKKHGIDFNNETRRPLKTIEEYNDWRLLYLLDDKSIFTPVDSLTPCERGLFFAINVLDAINISHFRQRLVRYFDFTPAHFDFNQLTAHLKWALNENDIERVAIDGLSTWGTAADRSEAAKMFAACNVIVARQKKPPAMMMTYELPADVDPLTMQTMGFSMDNVVVLRHINLQDEIHKIVYVLKSDGEGKDQNARELTFDKATKMFQVRSGLDTFNGLLGGKVEKAQVLLQLFRENQAEKTFNDWLKNRLKRLTNLEFTEMDFSRSDIGRTLEDIESQTLFPPSDLSIVNVDEWWLAYNHSKNPSKEHPLLDLRAMWPGNKSSLSLEPSWQEFWYWEVNKSGPYIENEVTDHFYAVPGWMNYGLFCIHQTFAKQLLKGHGESSTKLWNTYESWALTQKGRSLASIGVGNNLADIKAVWKEIYQLVPRAWTTITNRYKQLLWFDRPGDQPPETIVGLIDKFKSKGGLPAGLTHGFSFDLTTRETCVAFFFELAWAFGAEEKFLTHIFTKRGKHKLKQPNHDACRHALHFLCYLVLEDLMPAQQSVNSTRSSAFSRHYYSTLQSTLDLDRWDAHGGAYDEEQQAPDCSITGQHATSPPSFLAPNIIALPYYPAGCLNDGNTKENLGIEQALTEARDRHLRLVKLVELAGYNVGRCNISSSIGSGDKSSAEKLGKALEELMHLVGERPLLSPNEDYAPSFNDIREMIRLQAVRLALLGNTRLMAHLPSPGKSGIKQTIKSWINSTKAGASAGFCASGSWLYAVHHSTRSPSLAKDILQEITSMNSAEERARRGAGLPARSDFYELHGGEPVPGLEYLTWSDLQTIAGSRARRRSRAIRQDVNPVPIHQFLHIEIQEMLLRAEARKIRYNDGSNEGFYEVVMATNNEINSIIDVLCGKLKDLQGREYQHE